MTADSKPGCPSRPGVGLFDKLGSGNIGNDAASMESVLSYLRTHGIPNAVVDALCTGP